MKKNIIQITIMLIFLLEMNLKHLDRTFLRSSLPGGFRFDVLTEPFPFDIPFLVNIATNILNLLDVSGNYVALACLKKLVSKTIQPSNSLDVKRVRLACNNCLRSKKSYFCGRCFKCTSICFVCNLAVTSKTTIDITENGNYCIKCHHGGHQHALEYIKSKSLCPLCNCECIMETNK